ncbi:MAG: LysM peptidoglycan-binding domain-containing protein [Bacteriovoracaceae bacterium]|nr:LysM peptidoglycan-binding domain-containing protein [Bacteriovoracaceae bacterium]
MNVKSKSTLFILFFLVAGQGFGQDVDSLDLLDPSDVNVLIEENNDKGQKDFNISDLEEVDDLDSLKEDIGEIIFDEDKTVKKEKDKKSVDKPKAFSGDDDVEVLIDSEGRTVNEPGVIAEGAENENGNLKPNQAVIFDVGAEEKELLELSKFVEGKIPLKEWDEISAASQLDKYVIQKGDWLWKISQKLFGSGFYYSKIWSLNPQITNPHEIEPGMTLVFSTGDTEKMPEINLGDFGDDESRNLKNKLSKKDDFINFKEFGDQVKPNWIDERKKLIDNGVYFQFASDETFDDLKTIASENLKTDYNSYEPPVPDIVIKEPGEQYDESGFDKNSRIVFDVKEGFFLNTFVTSNIVQDLGEIIGKGDENIFINKFDKIYVDFDKSVKVKPGDQYSIYVPGGQISNTVSDRAGYKYTIGAQVKTVKKINQLWECEVTEISGLVQRGDRVTVYTPKIGKIIKTFNKRNIEAAVIGAYQASGGGLSFGDVIYLDRGRADGVEMGTVFELYSFLDKGTEKRLTPDPTYKIGEVTVISLTDNFATALISNSREAIKYGTIALTKTEQQAALDAMNRNRGILQGVQDLEGKALDELDIELSLDDVSQDLLQKADKVQLTEDELEELERQEREKSIIKDHERDLQELERLENEILEAEQSLNEAKVDEDKFLETQDLNNIEKRNKGLDPNAFESLNEIEGEIGLKFLDEDLNAKENPYGLTEFDLEEIDELLNTDQL